MFCLRSESNEKQESPGNPTGFIVSQPEAAKSPGDTDL